MIRRAAMQSKAGTHRYQFSGTRQAVRHLRQIRQEINRVTCPLETVPDKFDAVFAKIAYGAGVNC